jgi:hypothetical protein
LFPFRNYILTLCFFLFYFWASPACFLHNFFVAMSQCFLNLSFFFC